MHTDISNHCRFKSIGGSEMGSINFWSRGTDHVHSYFVARKSIVHNIKCGMHGDWACERHVVCFLNRGLKLGGCKFAAVSFWRT
jgi:hypothetical protein